MFLTAAKTALVLVALTAAQADTFTVATGSNTSLGTAQPVSLSPDLILNQIPPNFSLATAQSVSPLDYGEDVLGSITAGTPTEFFGVNVQEGQTLSFRVSSTTPASQPTELLLYDQNGNLVAVASRNGIDGLSSLIDFTIPSGASGVWSAEVVGPNSNSYNYDLRFTSPVTYSTDVLGSFTDPANAGFYSISTNVGDNLHLFVKTTSPTGDDAELLLYDANGNLVAIANRNATDGVSSVIDFTIPGGDAGNWTAEVFDPTTNLYKYDLLIQGATGTGPIDPLAPPAIATPEPSLCVLLGIACVGLALFHRKEKLGKSRL